MQFLTRQTNSKSTSNASASYDELSFPLKLSLRLCSSILINFLNHNRGTVCADLRERIDLLPESAPNHPTAILSTHLTLIEPQRNNRIPTPLHTLTNQPLHRRIAARIHQIREILYLASDT